MITLRRSGPESTPKAGLKERTRRLNPPWIIDGPGRYLVPPALIVVVLAAFGGTLTAGFHFDDFSLFVDPVITASSGWWEVWAPTRTRPLIPCAISQILPC